MSKKKKVVRFRIREFYDGGVIRLDLNAPVPSKRVGYKNENGVLVARVPSGAREFEAEVRRMFSAEKQEGWPMTGRLLVGIGLKLPKSRYRSTDVDNMAKTIIDAFRGLAYKDDSQIDALFVSKSEFHKCQVWIALKSLGQNPRSWFIEPMMVRMSEDENMPV